VLQCVAVYSCNLLCVAVILSESFPAIYTMCCSNLPSTAVCCMCCTHIGRVVANNTCIVLQCVAMCCSNVPRAAVIFCESFPAVYAVHCGAVQCVAVCCSKLLCGAVLHTNSASRFQQICIFMFFIIQHSQVPHKRKQQNYLSCAFTNPPLSSIGLFALPASCCVPSHPLAHTAATSMQHTATSSTEWAHAELMRTSAKMETYGNTPHHTALHHTAPYGTTRHHAAPHCSNK
jgi:hypothetical protein